MFTGDQFGDGAESIAKTLQDENIKASFFLTGNFYRDKRFSNILKQLKKKGHYLGAHSDRHLLYCDWAKRDSLLLTKEQFTNDLLANYKQMKRFGVSKSEARYFLPPFEWYNDSIVSWTKDLGLHLVNFSSGTISHADYTTPQMKNYRSSEEIYRSILSYETAKGMNGFILLVHIGTDPARSDKFYEKLPALVRELKRKGYSFLRIDELLN